MVDTKAILSETQEKLSRLSKEKKSLESKLNDSPSPSPTPVIASNDDQLQGYSNSTFFLLI